MPGSKRRFHTLGQYGRLTLPQARTEALEVFLRVRNGEDPAGERQAARKAPTAADLAERHVREHSQVYKKAKSALKDKQLWEARILPRLGPRRVADIERRDIARLIAEMASTPALANKARTLLGKAFNLAEIWGWRPDGSNPCRHVGRYTEESRERYLSESELRRLGEVLNEADRSWETSPHAIATIRLLILTGCRSAEILKLRWERRVLRALPAILRLSRLSSRRRF